MMGKGKLMVLSGLLVLILVMGNPAYAAPPKKVPADSEKIAAAAYVFGYPLVLMEITKKVLTNTAQPAEKAAPLNQFAHIPTFPRPEDQEVVRPNVDTLYSFAWLDLSREPVILQRFCLHRHPHHRRAGR